MWVSMPDREGNREVRTGAVSSALVQEQGPTERALLGDVQGQQGTDGWSSPPCTSLTQILAMSRAAYWVPEALQMGSVPSSGTHV